MDAGAYIKVVVKYEERLDFLRGVVITAFLLQSVPPMEKVLWTKN